MGPNSVTDPEILKGQLLEIRKQGYCICIDEMHENSISIAGTYTGLHGGGCDSGQFNWSKKSDEDKTTFRDMWRPSLKQHGKSLLV